MGREASKPVEDPGHAHLPKGGGISAPCQDFSGQDPYEDVVKEGIGDAPELEAARGGWTVERSDTSNPKNGSGGSCRVIDPSKVKGINP